MSIGESEEVAELLIEGLEDVINNINSNFIYSDMLEETSLSEDFMEDLLDKLETAHTELLKAFHWGSLLKNLTLSYFE